MAEEMDRAFGELGQGRREAEIAWLPNVEVTERDGNLDIKAELPGISPENVRLEITDDAVVLQGERKVEHQEDKGDLHLSERRYGRFYRRIPLPEGAKVEEAKATFDNGVLEVTVPVQRERQEPRQIPIQSGSSQRTERAA